VYQVKVAEPAKKSTERLMYARLGPDILFVSYKYCTLGRLKLILRCPGCCDEGDPQYALFMVARRCGYLLKFLMLYLGTYGIFASELDPDAVPEV
jgi:hypothetical protein